MSHDTWRELWLAELGGERHTVSEKHFMPVTPADFIDRQHREKQGEYNQACIELMKYIDTRLRCGQLMMSFPPPVSSDITIEGDSDMIIDTYSKLGWIVSLHNTWVQRYLTCPYFEFTIKQLDPEI